MYDHCKYLADHGWGKVSFQMISTGCQSGRLVFLEAMVQYVACKVHKNALKSGESDAASEATSIQHSPDMALAARTAEPFLQDSLDSSYTIAR